MIASQFTNLSKIYYLGNNEIRALDQIDYTINQGDFMVIAGPSGSGKSTFLNILGCLDKPSKGKLTIDGEDVTEVPLEQLYDLRMQKIGFVFQSFNLVPVLNAYENVELPLIFKYKNPAQIDRQVKEVLEKVGLEDRMYHKPAHLSGGQRQRVSIARALAGKPTIIIADEPTANLDRNTSASIMDLFEQLNQDEGVTLVIASHDPDVIARASIKVHIRDGKIL